MEEKGWGEEIKGNGRLPCLSFPVLIPHKIFLTKSILPPKSDLHHTQNAESNKL